MKNSILRFSAKVTQLRSDVGAISAEYATVAVAACGAGGILYKFLSSSSFASLLADILGKAFSWIFNLG